MKQSKVVLVTGAGRRIGAAIVRLLHAEGMNVVVHYRHSAAEAQALVNELEGQRTDSSAAICADLQDLTQVVHLAEQARQKWGRLDVLVNNASSFYPTPVASATSEQWDELFGSNVKSAYFLTQALQSELRRQQGCVVNITDIHGEQPMGQHSIYCMAKAALVMMTKSLAKDLAPDVRVNAVAPGAIIWPEGESELDDVQKQKIIDKSYLKRAGNPTDIANTVSFLVNQAPYVTGQVIKVAGGR